MSIIIIRCHDCGNKLDIEKTKSSNESGGDLVIEVERCHCDQYAE